MVNNVCICIPRLDRFSTKRTIRGVLDKYNFGSINRVDIVGSDDRRRAFIHFHKWNDELEHVKKVLDRLNSDNKVNIIHNFPWYWRCVKSRERKSTFIS